MENLFKQIRLSLFEALQSNEQLVVNFSSEESLFIRFNKSKVRQVSEVKQIELTIKLQCNGKESSIKIPLTSNNRADKETCIEALDRLRIRIADLTPLPFFIAIENHGQSRTVFDKKQLSCEEYLAVITPEIIEVDLAGILISGNTAIGNANSLGQHHWFESASFCFDYSLYTEKEKAVKAAYSGTEFSSAEFTTSLNTAKQNLSYMGIANRELPPGKYKCYLAPAAVSEILGTFNYGGPTQAGLKRGNSPLQAMFEGNKMLSPLLTLKEDFSLGLHPAFNKSGEVAADSMDVFESGAVKNLLTSSVTAKEFDLESNQANDSESMRSPCISTGDLKKADILEALGNGIYISNLHYLNWSDQKKGRLTGMTRFACFLVENGEIVAPIKDLRFDETIYNLWGDNLLAVTDFAEVEVSTDTYFKRSSGGMSCPGLLVKDFNFTL